MVTVSVIKCLSYEEPFISEAISEGLAYFGGIEKFVKPGYKVLLKVSLLSGENPEKAVTTHPAFIRAVAKIVQKAGGVVFIGDIPGNPSINMEEVFEVTGLKTIADELKVTLTNLKNKSAEKVKLKKCFVKEIVLSGEIRDFDLIINLPKLKTHNLMLLTGAVKNLYGLIPGFNKSKYHFLAPHPLKFAELLLGIYEVIKPGLTIMDGVVAMEGDGPSSGQPRKLGVLIIGEDAVAVDCVAASIIGYKEKEIPTIMLGEKRKSGVGNLKNIQVKGVKIDELRLKDFKKPKSIYRVLRFIPAVFFGLFKFIGRVFVVEPMIIQEICTGCKNCLKFCPAKAIKESPDGKLFIDKKQCILCFCCFEICPEKAIKINKNWLGKKIFSEKEKNIYEKNK